jgi:ethanolamine utilization protein EutN
MAMSRDGEAGYAPFPVEPMRCHRASNWGAPSYGKNRTRLNMRLAIVLGQVVSTVKHPGFEQSRLLLVDFIDPEGKAAGQPYVAADSIGAGDGEWVLVVQGSSARQTIANDVPIDMSVIGIVDEVVTGGKVTFHK